MSKKIQLTVPTPCHENWDKMTPVEKGKFCGSCQKQVMDFTAMSDREIAQFFKKPTTGSVCGRFLNDQLDREIEIPKKRIPWLKYFFQIALPAFFVTKISAQKTIGKIAQIPARDTSKVRVTDELRTLGMVLPTCIKPVTGDTIITAVKGEIVNKPVENRRTINGSVMDQTGSLLPGVSVYIKGTRTGVATDINGKFRLQARKGDIIIVSGVGFETREMTIDNEKELSIYLNRLTMGDAGIVVVAGHVSVKRPRKGKKTIPLITQLFKDTAFKFFKVYPNPVPAGSNISIEWKQTEEGYYTLQLFNQAGQPVHQQEIWIDAEARLLNIDIPVIAAGSYFLVMMNKKSGKKFTEKIIIQ